MLLAEAERACQIRALCRVGGRRHRVVGRQALLPVIGLMTLPRQPLQERLRSNLSPG